MYEIVFGIGVCIVIAYIITYYINKVEKFFYLTNQLEYVSNNRVKKLNICILMLLIICFMVSNINSSIVISDINSLGLETIRENIGFSFVENLILVVSVIIFSLFLGLWLIDVILFLLALPFQYVSYKVTKRFLINRKKKKGVLAFFLNFEKPTSIINKNK